jgi:predicted RNA-binding protein with PIN domain
MSLIIDGYNLLHASGIVGQGRGRGGLERSRLALLNFVVESLDAKDLPRATVVFDAGPDSPRGLPRLLQHRGLTVRFATGSDGADELIEEMILADSAPRRLTVVSSDHRLHRAARRRGAKPIDSDLWYADAVRHRQRRRDQPHAPPAVKPGVGNSEPDVEYWLRQFSDEPESEEEPELPEAEMPEIPQTDDVPELPDKDEIFPPGYAEDEEEK